MKTALNCFVIFFIGVVTLYAEDTCTLKVNISNFRSTDNKVIIYLYDDTNTDNFSKSDFAIKVLDFKVEGNGLFMTIPNLRYGIYAIALLHDEDGNREMTTNVFGIPKEGYGYSNDAKPHFGPPSFDEASFSVNNPTEEISIEIKYF